jgi:hypothetical protein
MVETLLSPSNLLLFGRILEDISISRSLRLAAGRKIKVSIASTSEIEDLAAELPNSIDGIDIKNKMRILVKNQPEVRKEGNGIYKILNKKLSPVKKIWNDNEILTVIVKDGTSNGRKAFNLAPDGTVTANLGDPDERHGPFVANRSGSASQIEQQLFSDEDPNFARIYGFSFEGYYYDLPRPVLFLVHGDGVPASQVRPGGFGNARAARAPGEPSLTGLGQADFQFSDDIMVWSYDKADYTIRMDVETGMFEDVLLAAMLGGSGGFDSAGMNARGMNARGMNARGMNARGMNARGMNARGGGNSD